MRKTFAAASLILLLTALTGCRHSKRAVFVPPPPPAQPHLQVKFLSTTLAEMPEIPAPALPKVVLGGSVAPAPPRRHFHPQDKLPKTRQQDSAADAISDASAGEEPPTTTPIGQLSAAPNTKGLPSRSSIAHEIQAIRQQLNKIHHALNQHEQNTATQIKTFLQKAENALNVGDLDAAHTLTVKARVMLSELK